MRSAICSPRGGNHVHSHFDGVRVPRLHAEAHGVAREAWAQQKYTLEKNCACLASRRTLKLHRSVRRRKLRLVEGYQLLVANCADKDEEGAGHEEDE